MAFVPNALLSSTLLALSTDLPEQELTTRLLLTQHDVVACHLTSEM